MHRTRTVRLCLSAWAASGVIRRKVAYNSSTRQIGFVNIFILIDWNFPTLSKWALEGNRIHISGITKFWFLKKATLKKISSVAQTVDVTRVFFRHYRVIATENQILEQWTPKWYLLSEALMKSNFSLFHLSFDGFRVSVESKLSVRWDRQWILAGLLYSTLNLTWRKVHSAVFVSNCFLFMGRFGQFHCFLLHRIIQIIRESR